MTKFHPDFDRVYMTAMLSGIPSTPPLMELWTDPRFKSAYLGHECAAPRDEIDFALGMHHDFVTYHLEWGRALARLEKRGQGSLYAIGRPCEFRTMDDVARFPWPSADEYDLEPLYDIARVLPAGMKIIATGGYTFAEAWMLMGFEHFAEATLLSPEIPGAIMDKLGEFRYQSFLRVINLPALGGIWYDDDIAYATGTMVHPAILRKHLFPWINKISLLCRQRCIPLLYHTDGNVRQVIPDIIAAGVNALHPIEPAAMDVFTLKEEYGGKLALIGNMDLDTIVRGTERDIETLVANRLPRLKTGGGFAPGTSNTIPEWMPVRNYLFFRDCCEKYGK